MEVLSAINSAEFTPEQKQYLLGFFAAAMRAYRAVWPYLGFDESAGRVFIGEKVAQGRKVQKFVFGNVHRRSSIGFCTMEL